MQTLGAVALFAEGSDDDSQRRTHPPQRDRSHRGPGRQAAQFGAEVEERADGLRITPRPLHGAVIDTYDDHRMAMSMALVGLVVPGVVIRDPGCTSKTYPDFFGDLAGLERATCSSP